VFQGGGCRAAALVGAYEVAIKHGVQFIEVAGTSAGSIIAALIGAGANPEQLFEFVKDLDFCNFLKPPEVTKKTPWLARIIPGVPPHITNLVFHQGFYSSVEIETWVESCLRKLLGDHQGPIPFSMLPYPTSVVATDILSRKPRVWNQKLSPAESVAKAVRASCSIPIFFQPVGRQYVDGGALSNLPAFVFANSAAGRPLTSRILAFVLKGNDARIEKWGTLSFLSEVAGTVVEGAQELQIGLQPDVNTIVIPTGDIQATDFDKVDATAITNLIDNGRRASEEFFQSELARVRTPRMPSAVCYDREDLYNKVTSHLNDAVEDVLIGEYDTEFVYRLFPSLLLWRLRGARMHVVVPKTEPKGEDGAYRRRLLTKLGVELVETDSLPFRGYFINGHDPTRGTSYVAIPSEITSHHIEAVIYEGTMHAAAIAALYHQLAALCQKTFPTAPPCRIISDSPDELLLRLKKVAQYSKAGVQLSIESVPLSNLAALANYVHEYKYQQMQYWIPEFKRQNLSLFESAAVELGGVAKSIITPPVVEASGEQYVLIEGSTRATYLRDQGEERMYCVVARGIRDLLPGTVSKFSNVRVVGRRMDVDFRYDNFDYRLFRQIELAVHPLNSFA
jgi:predicted acylesterase/phospholipase RssA